MRHHLVRRQQVHEGGARLAVLAGWEAGQQARRWVIVL